MRCHKCNQDSLDIENGHIICDICGLDIDVSNIEDDGLFDLFFYNRNLEEAEKLGHEAMLGGSELGDNPYSTAADQIILNNRWELGYKHEKESYELSALSLSAEKIQNDLKTKISILEEEKKQLEEKIDTFIPPNCKYIENFCSNLLSRKILGRILNKDILSFRKKYISFHRDKLGTWKHSD
jgi:hypothetical protein